MSSWASVANAALAATDDVEHVDIKPLAFIRFSNKKKFEKIEMIL